MRDEIVMVPNWYMLILSIIACMFVAWMVWKLIYKIPDQYMTKRRRRMAHLKHVDRTIVDLRYKIINLAIRCVRGDLSESAFTRRALNAAKLIHRYEIKRAHLNRLVR